jgi:hypothetical protein
MHRFWFFARLVVIIALGLAGNLPSFTGTLVPFCLVMGQCAIILSLIWTLVQGYRRKRLAAKSRSLLLKW